MEDNHAPGAGYSALLPPVMLFAAATSSVWVFQINDQQVKWTPPIQNVYRSVTDGWPTDRNPENTWLNFSAERRRCCECRV
jgi:hypothetical protein